MNGVSRKTFEGYDTDDKLNTLYDYIHDIWARLDKVERWKPINAATNLFGGIIGGAVAVLAYLKFFR